MNEVYRMAEFAKLAGVTVRTLQYYDRIGLVSPAQTTEGGHRLYVRRDLLRLQQILMLKWMGFKLDEIKELIESPRYDLRTALHMQKAAIESQLASLRAASTALEVALNSMELETGILASDALAAIIRAVTDPPDGRWAREFYTDETWAGITMRRMQYSTEEMARFTQDWTELIEQFGQLRHLPPDSPPVQRLAATMSSYLELFTAGGADTARSVERIWTSPGAIPEAYRMADQELERFMQAAMRLYDQTRKR